MSFSSEYLLLRYNSSATRYAFEVFQANYDGGVQTNPLDLSRNMDADLLIVRGTTKREFMGDLVLLTTSPGSVTYNSVSYTRGTAANLYSCLTATDLEAASFEDVAAGVPTFWDAQWVNDWRPKPKMEADGTTRVATIQMVER